MFGFLYLDVLHVHTAIVRRTNICMASLFGCLHVHTAIVRRTNICMPSFIWMYCIFIQQL